MSSIVYTQNDLEAPLTGTCTSAGTAANLTGVTAMVVHVLRPDRTVISRSVLPGATLATGAWSLTWQAGDLAVIGEHTVEVEVMWPGSRPQTFPGGRFTVQPEIA